MTSETMLWTATGVAAALVVLAGVADWRRANRSRIDDWGWMPWRGLQVAALFAGLLLAALALRG
ncbi:MAG: hypothetical protein ACT4N8_02475 [Sphingosinicella sp.]|uniref:hypothetical protein n=1 Tax=Sphingosinicella sp. TaxID=1917971 RepID=UPI004037D823